VRGPWQFKPEKRSMQVHPGELSTVMYEFQNVQNRRMAAQAIPSYAPRQAANHFNKLECFCFNQYTLEPGEKKSWPVAFVIDPKLSKDVTTITLSYTFFEVGGKTPAAPTAPLAAAVQPLPVKTGLGSSAGQSFLCPKRPGCVPFRPFFGPLSVFARMPNTSKTLRSSIRSTSSVWPSAQHCCLSWG